MNIKVKANKRGREAAKMNVPESGLARSNSSLKSTLANRRWQQTGRQTGHAVGRPNPPFLATRTTSCFASSSLSSAISISKKVAYDVQMAGVSSPPLRSIGRVSSCGPLLLLRLSCSVQGSSLAVSNVFWALIQIFLERYIYIYIMIN